MRIRSGFVSNSSSTSFLILTERDMSRDTFFSLVGVNDDSPLLPVFEELYMALLNGVRSRADFSLDASDVAVERFTNACDEKLSDRMVEKIQEAQQKGLKVMFGSLDSETSDVQTFFCCDSFELESSGLYINYLEAVW